MRQKSGDAQIGAPPGLHKDAGSPAPGARTAAPPAARPGEGASPAGAGLQRGSTPAAKVRTPHPLERFLGQRVVITLHCGTLIEGDLREIRDGTAYLEGAGVVGTKHKAVVGPCLLFLKENVSHVHPVPMAVERLAKEDA
jgi:hypothetical protein